MLISGMLLGALLLGSLLQMEIPPCVKKLLSYGANAKLGNVIGFTPLCLAAMTGKDKVVALLLENEAPVL